MADDPHKIWTGKAERLGHGLLERWRQLSSDHEFADALRIMADEVEDHDPSEAYDWYRESCELGHPKACMDLAWHVWDYSCSPSYLESDAWKERIKWYLQARKLGHPHAPITVDPLWMHSRESALAAAKKGSRGARANLGGHFAAINPPKLVMAHAWLSAAFEIPRLGGVQQSDAENLMPESFDGAKATLWFLDRILDDSELQRAREHAADIVRINPLKLPSEAHKTKWSGSRLFFRDRLFDAALNVANAIYTYGELSKINQERVKSEVSRVWLVTQPWTNSAGEVAATGRRVSSPPAPRLSVTVQNGLCVVAMQNLGIKPALRKEKWRRFWRSRRIDPYRSLDLDAQISARAYLYETHGIEIPPLGQSTGGIFE